MAGRALSILRGASAGSRLVGFSGLDRLAEVGGAILGPRLMPEKAAQFRRHLQRVEPDLSARQLDRKVRRGYGSYGRYWAETFRIPHLRPTELDRGFSFVGYWKIERIREQGHAPLLVLPHLGGWEWAAAWLGRVAGVGVSAVVERLEPEEVFQWFADLRSTYGVNVIPLGPTAMAELGLAAKRCDIICLLADRNVGGGGVEVEFFGETTALPAGPAVLSRRTGSPVLPTAVYFRGRQRVCVVGDPIWPDDLKVEPPQSGPGGTWGSDETAGRRPRDRYRAATALAAGALEDLIEQAPDQWHLLAPNWPSDH